MFISIKISIHAPAKGATAQPPEKWTVCLDFNPRSREGSDASVEYVRALANISILAPAKGATFSLLGILLAWMISIHAPAKGATM